MRFVQVEAACDRRSRLKRMWGDKSVGCNKCWLKQVEVEIGRGAENGGGLRTQLDPNKRVNVDRGVGRLFCLSLAFPERSPS